MARDNFDICLALTLRFEGGFSDHPRDPGGATNLGITQATLAAWRGVAVSKADVLALKLSEAAAIYRRNYWEAVGCDALPPGVDAVVFDYAVNAGPGRAARVLQKAAGVVADGIVGQDTIIAARRQDPRDLIAAIMRERQGFLMRLPIFSVFGHGWLLRLAGVEKEALRLAGPAVPSLPASQKQSGKETISMELSKSIFESKTVWANLAGLLAIVLSLFGYDAGFIQPDVVADSMLKLVAGISFVASTLFRLRATKQLK